MIWFVIAACLVAAGAVALWFSRTEKRAPAQHPAEPDNLFEPYRGDEQPRP